MGLSAGEINKACDAITGRANYTANAAVYAQLHTGAPGAAGTANVSSDTSRKVTAWAAPSAGSIATSAALSWTLALSGSETLTHVSFWTSVTPGAGTFLGDAALSASATMSNGETFNISAGLTQSISASKWSDTVKNAVLNAWAGLATYTMSAGFFLQNHTGDPGAAGTSNVATDTTRKAITFGTAAASGSIANTAAAQWANIGGPTAPTTESIAWQSAWTAITGGTFLMRDDLPTARPISSGDQLDVAIGAVVVSAS